MPLSLWWLLVAAIFVLMAVRVIDLQVSRQRSVRLRLLAQGEEFQYSVVDRFDLTCRLREMLPDASGGFIVRDLMYRSDHSGHVFVFTAVVAGEHGGQFVIAGQERVDQTRLGDVWCSDAALPIGEQYRRLIHKLSGEVSSTSTAVT